jgi:hypothetical protein
MKKSTERNETMWVSGVICPILSVSKRIAYFYGTTKTPLGVLRMLRNNEAIILFKSAILPRL